MATIATSPAKRREKIAQLSRKIDVCFSNHESLAAGVAGMGEAGDNKARRALNHRKKT